MVECAYDSGSGKGAGHVRLSECRFCNTILAWENPVTPPTTQSRTSVRDRPMYTWWPLAVTIYVHAFSTVGYLVGILWLKFYANLLSFMGWHTQTFHLNGLPTIHLTSIYQTTQAHFATDTPNLEMPYSEVQQRQHQIATSEFACIITGCCLQLWENNLYNTLPTATVTEKERNEWKQNVAQLT